MKVGPLSSAHPDAVVHAVDGLGEGTFGGVYLVAGEEAGDLIALLDSAEVARRSDDADAGVGRELGVGLVPVLLNVIPRLVTRLAIAQ